MTNYGIFVNNKTRSSSVRIFVKEKEHYHYCGSANPKYKKIPSVYCWTGDSDLTLGAPLVMAVWDD